MTKVKTWTVQRRAFWGAAKFLALLMLSAGMNRAYADDLDRARDRDPVLDLHVQVIHKFDPRLQPLWLEALGRPEADLKRQVIEAIVYAHNLGMPGWKESAPRLLEELEATDASPNVQYAAAQALIALDAHFAAPALMKYSQKAGFDASRLIEPALMRWHYAPMKPTWLARLQDPRTAKGSLHLAVQAATATQMTDAVPFLKKLALDQHVARGSRVEAARALAVLQPVGLESEARQLALAKGAQQITDRLVAATFLVHHQGPDAEALLLQLAADEEPVVAIVAATRLFDINPLRLKTLVGALTKSPDAGLRKLAVKALKEYGGQESVDLLAPMLNDPHIAVRGCARDALIQLASKAALREPIERAVLHVLNADNPLGLEQAARIVGALRYRSGAKRLLALLDVKSPPGIAAAWALRCLADSATADPILKWLEKETEKSAKEEIPKDKDAAKIFLAKWKVTYEQMEHLLEAIGVMHYRPAAPLLLKYMPLPPREKERKDSMAAVYQHPLRLAAVWSLGHMVKPEPEWTDALQKVLASQGDASEMIAMAAIGLGRLKSKDAKPLLERYYQEDKANLIIHRSCAWALEKFTGKSMPLESRSTEKWHKDWFLEPMDK